MQPTLTCKTANQGFLALVNYFTANVPDSDVRISNCRAESVSDSASELAALGSQAATHLILSYPHGQAPSGEQIFADEDSACSQSNLSNQPRISAVHREADHVHVHIAVAAVAVAP
jgi:hypothetical protein